ncbi:SDR family oxidoreductase [Emcibacteraceae bacterium]|jgi:NAD(P)-dependent dehydrogenase (short-subunit alcohol dehydrogenase family)|nr:SDR family oxidoreductase [Emcibacteraceae bacterium]|tara:strand:+ start:4189 stop:4980 length:792 start_codon:yes stop_codon:yes gene_type:complete
MAKPRISVVIGGTSGIGKAIALKFASEGDFVVVSGRDRARGKAVADACKSVGGQGHFLPCELASPESIVTLAATIIEQFGPAHVLVNSGGILQSGQRVLDQKLDEDEALWKVNYRGTLIACQEFGRQMRVVGSGAILNLGSLASFAPLSLPAYTPSKQAILGLTQILAAELGPHGVRVNAVAPGYTMSDGLKAKIAGGKRNPEAIKATTALRAFVEPEHVAEAASFLCSDKAASITGVTLPVDAGWLVQAPYAAYLQGNPISE